MGKFNPRITLAWKRAHGLAGIVAPVSRRRWRAESGGKLLTSSDSGQSWEVAAHFGPQHEIEEIWEQGAETYVRLKLRTYTYVLKSSDGREWHRAF